jgi:hypothetical protein
MTRLEYKVAICDGILGQTVRAPTFPTEESKGTIIPRHAQVEHDWRFKVTIETRPHPSGDSMGRPTLDARKRNDGPESKARTEKRQNMM